MSQQNLIITGLQIYTEKAKLNNASVVIENQKIKVIENKVIDSENCLKFPENWHLIPGMIDMHIHGAAGKDVMDSGADVSALATICQALPKEGVTAFLPTTLSMPISTIEQVLHNVAAYTNTKNNAGAEILGIYLEGPFLSPAKNCAHPLDCIIQPNIELFKRWQSIAQNLIKVVTVAPEETDALELIAYLKQQNIIAAFGHSGANYEQGLKAIEHGVSQVTHLFNAMHSLHHRNPAAITALLLDDKVLVEVIADSIHLYSAIIKLIYKIKGAEKILLITDAISAKGMPAGTYSLGGQKVILQNNRAQLEDGTLAGSVLKMDQAMRNVLQFTGCSLQDVIKMTSENPAKQLNIFDRKGSIATNKESDLVVLNEKYEVMMTICKGKIAYQSY